MNVNVAIIDQRLNAVVEDVREFAGAVMKMTDETRLRSLAFVQLCVQTVLGMNSEEAMDCLTEGGGDFGVDAFHIGESVDGEFVVTLFQCKYTHKNLEGAANFDEDGVGKAVNAVRFLFDPHATVTANPRILSRMEDVRSRIVDGELPRVRFLLCNNGIHWNDEAQKHIDRLGAGEQVSWEHVNHDTLLAIIQATKPVSDTLRLSGKAIVEDFDFSRVMIGKALVTEIAQLLERHGDRLLERNIRRYLGLVGNRVNEGIRGTLLNADERKNFYFYNNGITLTCAKFDYNALQQGDHQVRIDNLQIINGGQTCNTLLKVLRDLPETQRDNLDRAFVLVRLYQLPEAEDSLVQNITFATNSQNPVDLRDLRANDPIQVRLETDIRQIGYNYRRKRVDGTTRPEDITTGATAEAVLAVLRRRPHQAKFFTREHFGKLYETIFNDTLTGAEVVISTLLYRIAENRRKRPEEGAPSFRPYASCFVAMRMGDYLRHSLNLGAKVPLTHKEFDAAKKLIESQGDTYFQQSERDIEAALNALYGRSYQEQSLQRLAATFRRGDLIEELDKLALSETQPEK